MNAPFNEGTAAHVLEADLEVGGPLSLAEAITSADAESLFETPGALLPMLQAVAEKVREFKADPSTEAGRKAIASLAFRIARAKTRLDDLGKDIVAELKARPARIDANRKVAREFLDALKAEVRVPLDAWEEAQNRNAARVDWFRSIPSVWTASLAELRARLEEIQAAEIDDSLGAWKDAAEVAKLESIDALQAMISSKETAAAEAEELAALRQMKAQRDAELAAEEARRVAAEKAEAERLAAAEREAQAAKDREAQAIRQKEEAEAREKAAVARELQAAEEARLAEVRRQEETRREEARELLRRAQDLENRIQVNREITTDLEGYGGLSEEDARSVLAALSTGAIRHVSVRY